MKKLRYIAEAIFLWTAFLLFRILGAQAASDCGGWIGRTVGPKLAASRKARTNLQNAFADMSDSEYDAVIAGMWDNLGRVIAEYPHLKTITEDHVEIKGEEHLAALGKNGSFLIFGGHIANWELLPFYFNYRADCEISGIYRAPNNPYVEYLLDRCRNPEDKGAYIPKSHSGTKEMVRTLQNKGRIAILIDQKYNQGIPVEFFGRDAMTSSALAQLATKFDLPILPFQVERLDGCKFRLTLHPPFKTEGRTEADVMLHANRMLEDWIARKPAQWLWLHRRWDSKALQ